MRHTSEYDFEPVPGLPQNLPAGERMLWQGSPEWGGVARRIYHVPGVAIYFGLLVAWRIAAGIHDGLDLLTVLESCTWIVGIGTIGVGLLIGLAWGTARSTIFTMTDRRLVMRYGMALPIALNLPFNRIDGAGVKRHADGTGDIQLTLGEGDQMSYLVLWPFARPWHVARTQPMLRSIANPQAVAELLSGALAASATAAPAPAPIGIRSAPAAVREADGLGHGSASHGHGIAVAT